MATYVNPQGSVDGTSGADTFVFDTPLQAWATIDAREDVDLLTVDYSAAAQPSFFRVNDPFNTGTFYGTVQEGVYSPKLVFYNFEDVRFVGSAFADSFDVAIRPASSALSLTIDGGAGIDTLLFDAKTVTSPLIFRVEADGSITSSFGAFANLEKFTITSGSGDDVIHTGGQNDSIYAYGGSDEILTGLGDDHVYTESGGDYVDMGAGGYDFFQGNYSAETAALTVSLGDTITVSNGVTALNVESASIGTGSGDDQYFVTRPGSVQLYAGAGYDSLTYDAVADGPREFSVQGYSGILYGSGSALAFNEFEWIALRGGAFADTFRLSGTYDPASISLDGGGGTDRLEADFSQLTGGTSFIVGADGTIVANRGQFASFETFVLTGGGGADAFTTSSGSDRLSGAGGDDLLDSGAGIDSLFGGDGNDQLFGGADNDSLSGEAGDDLLEGGAGNDQLFGGADSDTAGYATAGGAVTVSLALAGTAQQTGGAGLDTLFSIENLTGSAFADTLKDDGGNNRLDGGGGNDFLWLTGGGSDTALGGTGNDVFLFGGSMTGADSVDGGSGTDQLVLQGDYWGANALTLGTGFVSVENFAILPGDDTRFGDPGTNFYDYNVTTRDVNVAAGVQLVVDANRLRVGEDFTFNGSAELDGSFFIYGGGGTDTLTGGANNDVFLFGAQGQWGASDVVNGGSGGIDQLALRGNYTLTFGAGQLIGIENIGLLSAHDTRFGALGSSYSYDLTMVDANVASGVQMTVDGAKLRVAEHFRFDGSAEMNGSFKVFGGLVDDTIIGSQNGDFIQGYGGLDTLTGGGGADIFRYLATSDSTTGAVDRILDFTPGTDKIDLTRIDADTTAVGDQAFHWIGSNAFGWSGTPAGELRAYQNGGSWFVEGDTNGDGTADLVIELVLQGPTPLGAGDFLP